MQKNKLTPQQLKPIYNQTDEPLIDFRTYSLIILQRTAIVTVILLLIVSITIKIPLHLRQRFTVINSTPELTYSYPHTVYIEHKYKKTGDIIKQNDKLITISSPEIAENLSQLNNAKSKLNNFEAHTKISLLNEIESLKSEIAKLYLTQNRNSSKLLTSKEIYQKEFTDLKQKRDNAISKLNAANKLKLEGFISKFDILALKENVGTLELRLQKVIKNQQITEQNLITQNNIINRTIRNLKKEIENKHNYIKTVEEELKNNVKIIQNKILITYGNYKIENNKLTLISPANSTLSYIAAKNTKEVKEGEILLRLTPENALLRAEIKISPLNIGQIKLNQEVYLKVSSFPSFIWGTLEGKIATLSTSPDENGYFHATVDLNKNHNQKLTSLLCQGMTGIAAIRLDKKTFIRFLFEKWK
jgi:multidrug efflux pump subunit AcrA (membrane-fusion protein)